jgi:hypothetical protein
VQVVSSARILFPNLFGRERVELASMAVNERDVHEGAYHPDLVVFFLLLRHFTVFRPGSLRAFFVSGV